ncbi:protein Skeletor, isoforms B/C-like [Watersipora subatra]|uniref:protein Skeletor, isoforms B/C-like n=1 Tax=Watersipora subatra TaxID=2589382 RepID=UPI00355AFAEE
MACLLQLALLCVVVGSVDGKYYGKEIATSWGSSASNGLAGSIYAVDKNTIQIIGFSFTPSGDGAGTAILMGKGKTFENAKTSGDLSNAVTVMAGPLRSYNGEDIIFDIADGVISDFGYLAVGNTDSQVLYGGASIPQGFVAPAQQDIGTFTSRAHSVRSQEVTVIDDRTIFIRSFRYDGQGPDAYFYVGVTDAVKLQQAPYGIIPDENGVSDKKATQYSDRDIMLTLPSTISAIELKWLSMFCISYSHNFGEVTFPDDLNVPPHIGQVDIDREGFNCEAMSEQLQVSWLITNDSITFELAGNINRNEDYMAFGLSGSTTRPQMNDADVVVADYREGSTPRAVDYFITSKAQCSSNGGTCPDTSTANVAIDDVTDVSAEVTYGITRVKYTRARNTGDAKDKEYMTDGTEQQVVWAVGPLNTKKEAAKHYTNARSSCELYF